MFNLQIKLQNLAMESSFTSEINIMNYTYDILLKRKQEIYEKIKMQRKNVHSNIRQSSLKTIGTTYKARQMIRRSKKSISR